MYFLPQLTTENSFFQGDAAGDTPDRYICHRLTVQPCWEWL